jgi:hypothetical protein
VSDHHVEVTQEDKDSQLAEVLDQHTLVVEEVDELASQALGHNRTALKVADLDRTKVENQQVEENQSGETTNSDDGLTKHRH